MAKSRQQQAVARYWRQVRAVRSAFALDTRTARKAVRGLRERGITSANKVRALKRAGDLGVATRGKTVAIEIKRPYRDLDDFLADYDDWSGEYDYFEIETSADY